MRDPAPIVSQKIVQPPYRGQARQRTEAPFDIPGHRFGRRGLACAVSFLLILFWSSFSLASSPSGSETAPGRPQLVIDNPQADLGEVIENGTISHDFVVRNAGTAPLSIEQVRPG